MSRKTHRAAIFAVAAMLMATIANAEGQSALAQETALVGTNEVPNGVENGQEIGEAAPTVRFVASEVVQPLPQEAEATASEEPAKPPFEIPAAASLSELVGDMPVESGLSDDMRCLAQAIYFEARGEPLAGQLAVGRVIVNRAESAQFPDSYCGVVKQRSQFSFVKRGRIPAVNTASAAWKRAKAIARIAHQELWDSPANDALFFHATYVKPSWARKMTARATIDSHIFYR